MQTHPKGSHYINGRHTEDTAGAPLMSVYPASGEVIAKLHSATPDIVDQALAAADAARGAWAAMTGSARGRILRRAAEIIRDRNRDLSVLETCDTGKPLQETLVADAASGVGRENSHAAIEHYSEMKSVYLGLSPVEAAF